MYAESKPSTSELNLCPAQLCIAVGREYNYGKGLPGLPARVTSKSKTQRIEKRTKVLKEAPITFDYLNNSSNGIHNVSPSNSYCSVASNNLSGATENRPKSKSKQKNPARKPQNVGTSISSSLLGKSAFDIDEKETIEINNVDSLPPQRKVEDGSSTLLYVPPPSMASLQHDHSKPTLAHQLGSSDKSARKHQLQNERLKLDLNHHQRQYGAGDGISFVSNSVWDTSSGKAKNGSNVRSMISLNKNDSEKTRCVTMPLLTQRLAYLWENKLYTDVIFIVGWVKAKIEAHRIILASASEIFQSLLYNEGKPMMVEGKYILYENDFSESAFEVFIKAMYTNEIPISLSIPTALEVFYATKKYGVVFLENQVIEHIKQLLTVYNVFEALRFSTNAVELAYLAPSCWKLIEEQTREVLEYHLENLDAQTFQRILERDRLNVDEVELFQTAVRWAANLCRKQELKTTGKNKRKFMDTLIKHFRFTTMTPTQFSEDVVPSRVLDAKEIQQIQNAFIKSGEARSNSLPYKTTPRMNTTKQAPAVEHDSVINWDSGNGIRNQISSTNVPKIRSDSAVVIPHLKAKMGHSAKAKRRNPNKAR